MRTSTSVTEFEIQDQPRAWERAQALAAGVDLFPARSRVALIGCGSSWAVAMAIATLRESRGLGETDAFAASEAPLGRPYDRVIAISRSGTTSELLAALAQVRPGTRRVALVGDPASPVAGACDQVLSLDFADDQSVVQTRFVTTVIAFVRAWLGDDIAAVVRDGEAALGQPLPEVADRPHHVFLGVGWKVGLAAAAALVMRETAQATCESYPAMEYRHGPIAAAGEHTAVWFLGDGPPGLKRQIQATGAAVIESTLDPLAQLVRVHRVAVGLARARKLDVDRPPHLSRSVVLEPAGSDGTP